MAICFNCGATVPDGIAFCTNCGARIGGAPRPQTYSSEELPYSGGQENAAPQEQNFPPREQSFQPQEQNFLPREQNFPPREPYFNPQPEAAPVQTPNQKNAKKKSLKLPLIIGGAVLLIALVLGVLFFTGVLGGGSADLEGVWTLVDSGSAGLAPGDIVLELQADGVGTATILGQPVPLTWTKKSITINGNTDKMSMEDDKLVFEENGGRYVFERSDAPAEPAAPGGAFGGAFGANPAANDPAPAATADAPATEAPVSVPATPMPSETPINKDGDGPYWNLPAFTYDTGKSFPFGHWGGVYVYNGNFFKTYFVLNEDYTCTRTIYRNGVVVTDEKGEFEYDGKKIKLYMNGERNQWTEYVVTDQMMVNNNHEFFRQDPGGVIGAWVGDYMYNNKHIHTTYILRTDGTYSEVTYRDEEKVTDSEGTWTFDGSTLKLKDKDTPNITTPFTYVDGVLINNNYKYWLS